MKRRYIGIGIAVMALCLGVFTSVHFGYLPMGAAVQPSVGDPMIQQSVDEAVEKAETQYRAERQEKDVQIAALKGQLEELTDRLEKESDPQAPGSQQDMPVSADPGPSEPASAAPAAPIPPVQQQSVGISSETTSPPPQTSQSEGLIFTFEATGNGAPELIQKSNAEDVPADPADDFDYTLEEFAEEVFYWTNVIREEHGLPVFVQDPVLDEMAQIRATEGERMTHTRPDGSTPDTIFDEYDTELVCTGENITGAGGTPKSVAYGFLETSHRENILNPKATHLGIGCRWSETVIGDRIAVLQLFAE